MKKMSKLKMARQNARLTQKAVALELGVSVGYISNMENLHVSVTMEMRIALALIYSVDPKTLLEEWEGC